MPSSPVIKALGLNISQNQLEVAPGTLSEANDIIIRRDDIVESRRGFGLYGTPFGLSTDRAKQLANYKLKILRHYSNKIQVEGSVNNDGDVEFFDLNGTVVETKAGLRVKSIEANGNFYVTTSDGIKKISVRNNTDFSTSTKITKAGAPQALDLRGRTQTSLGFQGGFLPQDSVVSYKVLWGEVDANNNTILGTPSEAVPVYNYQIDLLLQDYNRLLGALDDVSFYPGGGLITDGNYASLLALPITASSADLKAKLHTATTNLVGKLDADIGGTTFASITPVPVTQTIPEATQNQLDSLSSYLQKIIDTLNSLPIGTLSAAAKAAYISPLALTTTANVVLDFTIPDDIEENRQFYQVYRTSISTASGVLKMSELTVPTDYQLIDEVFPTLAEITSQSITYTDITADGTVGQNLYSNTSLPNEPPPYSLDINRFKNYVFYANTRIKNNLTLTLAGTANVIAEYNKPFSNTAVNNVLNTITIPNHGLVSGRKVKIITVTGMAGILLAGSNEFYVVRIDDNTIKLSTSSALTPIQTLGGTWSGDFVVSIIDDSPKLTIANSSNSNTYEFVIGSKQITYLTCLSGGYSTGVGSYFLLNAAQNTTQYYVWYKVDTLSADPKLTVSSLANKTGIQVDILSTDPDTVVAQKTISSLAAYNYDFTAVVSPLVGSTNSVLISTTSNGVTTPSTGTPTAGTISTYQYGQGEDISSIWATATSYTINQTVVYNNQFYRCVQNHTSGTFLTDLSNRRWVIATRRCLLSNDISPSIAVEDTIKSLVRVCNRNAYEVVYAFYQTGLIVKPGTVLLQGKELTTEAFSVITNSSTLNSSIISSLSTNLVQPTSFSFGAATTINVTNHGLITGDKIIITNTQPSSWVDPTPAVVTNGFNVEIDGIYTVTRIGPNSFSIPVATSSFTGTVYPIYSRVSDSKTSSDDRQPHRIFYSKFQEPEAVPLLNYIDVGTNDREILRIFPLRDSLFVFKEDGLYRLSGEIEPFVVSLFDSSCILIAPDSVGISNNQIYCWTTQGISIVTESGVTTISRPIDVDVLRLASSEYANFKTATWGVGYDSDNSYIVYTVKNTDDTKAEKAYRYSNLTNTWTVFNKTATCGLVNIGDDKLYFGAGDTNYIEKERKTFTRYDYTDRELDYYLNTNSYFSNVLKFPVVSTASVGDVLVQTQTVTTYNFNSLLQQLDTDPLIPTTNFLSTLQLLGGNRPRTNLEGLASKLDSDISPIASPSYASTIQSRQSIVIAQVDVGSPCKITSTNHGLETGRWISISGVAGTTPSVNGIYQVTKINVNEFTINVAVTVGAGVGGTFSTVDDDFRDLKACFNLVVNKLNTDIGVGFSNYQLITDDTVQECIVTKVDTVKKELTTNITLGFVVGPVSLFKAIPCNFVYNPLTMGDPLGLKHLREATLMFINKAFTSAKVSFSTDLQPEVMIVPFNGDGNGIFGHSIFGLGFFGGSSNSAPFRTIIPRQCQRCRYILVGFSHSVAREQWAILGTTLTGEVGLSTRAYR